jgi:hypothetical protein
VYLSHGTQEEIEMMGRPRQSRPGDAAEPAGVA